MLIVLIAVWFIMTVVGLVALGAIDGGDSLKSGEIEKLIAPIDYDGRLCGYRSEVKDKKYGYYLLSGAVVCVDDCPKTTDFEKFICLKDDEFNGDANSTTGWIQIKYKKCLYEIKSKPVLNRCIFDSDSVNKTELESKALKNNPSLSSTNFLADLIADPFGDEDNSSTFVSAFVGDIYNFQGVIFGFGIGVAVFVAFLYVTFLRIPGVLDVIVWGIVLVLFAALVAGAVSSYTLANDWESNEELDKSNTEITMMRAVSWIVGVFAILYLCLMIYLRSRIKLAITVTKEAGHALTDVPATLSLPVIQAIGLVIFLVPFIIYVLFLVSSGEFKTTTTEYSDGSGGTITSRTRYFEYNENTNYAFLFMLFVFFWTTQFIVSHGQLILAMTFSAWYFTKGEARRHINNGTFFWALKKSFIHTGSTAFGALVIAICKYIRAILAYIQKQAEKSGNKIAEYTLCVCRCCMWCVENCMKFLNKNAYIQIAIYGYSFCTAARSAFFLVLRNLGRIFAVSRVSAIVTLLGKFFIPVVTTFLAYCVLVYTNDSAEMNGIVLPLICVYILAFMIAVMFNEIYSMGIQTIILCFIADEEMFENPADRFVPGTLKNTLTSAQRKAQALQNEKTTEVVPGDENDDPVVTEMVSPDNKIKPSP